jgi:hypothetical protein
LERRRSVACLPLNRLKLIYNHEGHMTEPSEVGPANSQPTASQQLPGIFYFLHLIPARASQLH